MYHAAKCECCEYCMMSAFILSQKLMNVLKMELLEGKTNEEVTYVS